MPKVVVNRCFGGFGLSDAAYEKLIEWGIPLRDYFEEHRDPDTGLFADEPRNNGIVIFRTENSHVSFMGKYWDTWTASHRDHPLVVRVVEELGEDANGRCARLDIVEVPDDVDWEISEYDGSEHVAEKHRTW